VNCHFFAVAGPSLFESWDSRVLIAGDFAFDFLIS